jgi:hypothetical protein
MLSASICVICGQMNVRVSQQIDEEIAGFLRH